MNSKVSYEIYASTGRMVYEGQSVCSKPLQLSLGAGNYTIEAKAGDVTKQEKFTIGGGTSLLTIDLTHQNKESSHQDLINADAIASKQSLPVEKVVVPKEQSVGSLASDMEEAQKSMAQLGNLLSGVQKIKRRPIQALKQSVIISLPGVKKAKACYVAANDMDATKACEQIEEDALKLAQQSMEKSTGMKADINKLEKHDNWSADTKKATIKKSTEDIRKMELSITCIDKGASFANLNQCIKDNGEFSAKKSDIELMGDLFKAFGKMK